VARQTRQQRRARREQGDGNDAKPAAKPAAEQPKLTQRARARQQQVRPSAQAPRQQTGRREAQPRGRFIRESWAELKKVEWPGRNQVMQATVVVIIACAIVGAYLYVADLVFRNLVERIL
jgi:preprotein translocase subunit SecE